MKKIISLILVLCFTITLSSCKEKAETDKRILAVSIVPEATFLEKVCGNNFEIITMIPPGASAETYEPTIPEIADLNDSLLYFAIGIPAEQNIILPSINDKNKIVELHTAAEKVYPALTSDEGRDPHLWLSPKRVVVMVGAIAEAICGIDPENAAFYKQNAKDYCEELTKLDREISDLLKTKQNRKFIAYHPAFGYFADDYNLTQYALEEHGKEADAKHMSEIIDLAKKEEIKIIFYQAETSGRQAKAFAEELGGNAVMLEPLAADYINNLKTMANSLSEAMK